MRRARVLYKVRKGDELCIMLIDIPNDIRKDRDGIRDYCSDFLQNIFGDYYSLSLDIVT